MYRRFKQHKASLSSEAFFIVKANVLSDIFYIYALIGHSGLEIARHKITNSASNSAIMGVSV